MSLKKLVPITLVMPFWVGGMFALGCSENDNSGDGGQELSPQEDGQIEPIAESELTLESEPGIESAESNSDFYSNCSFQILPAGGSQEICGLRIMAPPNAVTEAKNILVTHPALNPKLPTDDLEQNSLVFSLQTDLSDFSFKAYVNIYFPHESNSSIIWVAKYFSEFGSWGVLETCFKDDQWGGIRTSSLGTYTVLKDLGDNGASGAGQVLVNWNQNTGTFSCEGLGFARFLPAPSGNRAIELYGVRIVNELPESFKLTFTWTATNEIEVGTASLGFYDQEGQLHSWINYPEITPSPAVTISGSETEKNHLVGTLSGKMYELVDPNWVEHEVSASFDVTMVRYFFLSDDPCMYEP